MKPETEFFKGWRHTEMLAYAHRKWGDDVAKRILDTCSSSTTRESFQRDAAEFRSKGLCRLAEILDGYAEKALPEDDISFYYGSTYYKPGNNDPGYYSVANWRRNNAMLRKARKRRKGI